MAAGFTVLNRFILQDVVIATRLQGEAVLNMRFVQQQLQLPPVILSCRPLVVRCGFLTPVNPTRQAGRCVLFQHNVLDLL